MRRSARSPVLAAVLSFFQPGLGQVYAGAPWRGVLLAVPQIVAIVVLLVLYVQGGVVHIGTVLLVQYAFGFAVFNVLLLIYRAYAVIDAYLLARGARSRPAGTHMARGGFAAGAIALTVLLVADVAAHGWVAYTSYRSHLLFNEIAPSECDPDAELLSRDCPTPTPLTAEGPTPTPEPTAAPTSAAPTEPGATPGPTATGATPTPAATPSPTPTANPWTGHYWAENGRLDILLLGADAGPDRVGLRPDAIHIASVELASGRTAILSLPRYLQYPPLPPELAHLWPCGCFRAFGGYLNAIYTYAGDHPRDFPGGKNAGFRATARVVETLLGIEIDGIVVVDLNGFVDAIDAIGGITMYVPEAVRDSHYSTESGPAETVDIKAGWHHFNGHDALKYVRSRHQDGDIQRLSRQQNFLRALRNQLLACSIALIPRLPDLLDKLKGAVRTDIPLDEIPTLIDLLSHTGKPRRIELTSDNGFRRDLLEPGMHQLYLAAAARMFEGRPGDETDEPDPTPPPRLGYSC